MGAVKKVDAQGRVALPAKWRARELRDTNEVIVSERGSVILVKPRRKPDLTQHFDAATVWIDPSAFSDYSKLKKAVLGRGRT